MRANKELLKETAKLIKAKGFDIFQSTWKATGLADTYFYFTDGKNIGYCQTEYGGIKFSSQHKPSTEFGTGYSLQVEPLHEVNEEIIDKMIKKVTTPDRPGYLSTVKSSPIPWESWEAFKKRNSSCEYAPMNLED